LGILPGQRERAVFLPRILRKTIRPNPGFFRPHTHRGEKLSTALATFPPPAGIFHRLLDQRPISVSTCGSATPERCRALGITLGDARPEAYARAVEARPAGKSRCPDRKPRSKGKAPESLLAAEAATGAWWFGPEPATWPTRRNSMPSIASPWTAIYPPCLGPVAPGRIGQTSPTPGPDTRFFFATRRRRGLLTSRSMEGDTSRIFRMARRWIVLPPERRGGAPCTAASYYLHELR